MDGVLSRALPPRQKSRSARMASQKLAGDALKEDRRLVRTVRRWRWTRLDAPSQGPSPPISLVPACRAARR